MPRVYTRSWTIKPGDRFGRVTVLDEPFKKDNSWRVRVSCDCGKEYLAWVSNLASGHSRQCRRCQSGDANRKHGLWATRLYAIWGSMRHRCSDKNRPNYGDRGVEVCPEWRDDFLAFRKWALASGYDDTLHLDRRNNDGNYEPGNCRWVTRTVNNNNKRNNRYLTAFGETKTLADWSRDDRCTVRYHTVAYRVRRGVQGEAAITNTTAGVASWA
jgi:hypothetical protein